MNLRTPRILRMLLGSIVISSWPCSAQVAPATFELRDATNQLIGNVLDAPFVTDVNVPMTIDGHPVLLRFNTTTFFSAVHGNVVYFTSNDCTGQGYVVGPDPSSALWENSAVVGPNATLYAGTPQTGQDVIYNSFLNPYPASCVQSPQLFPISVAPVQRVRDLVPMWQPPFHVTAVVSSGAASVPAVTPAGLAVMALLIALGAIPVLRRATR